MLQETKPIRYVVVSHGVVTFNSQSFVVLADGKKPIFGQSLLLDFERLNFLNKKIKNK